MAITLRDTKGSALTHEEMDLNFSALTGSIEAGDGLQGGGSKSGSITLSIGEGDGIEVSSGGVQVNNTVARTGSNTFEGNQIITGSVLIEGVVELGKGLSATDSVDKYLKIGNNTSNNGRVWFAPTTGSPALSNFEDEFGFEWTSMNSGRWYVEQELIIKDDLVIGSEVSSGELDSSNILVQRVINTTVDSGTTNIIASIEINSHDGMILDYILKKGVSVKVGTIQVAQIGTGTSDVTFNEYSTQDTGDTSDVEFSADISGGLLRIKAVASTVDNWTVKGLLKAF